MGYIVALKSSKKCDSYVVVSTTSSVARTTTYRVLTKSLGERNYCSDLI